MERRAERFRPLIATTVLAAAAGLVVSLLLPPAARVIDLPPAADAPADGTRGLAGAFSHTVRGVYHVHSRRSDGSGTVPEIAAAAAAAGLDFVILTDHGDATGVAPPAYHDGVLMIDGVEISTDGGHYAAVGLGVAPYPLGGDARGVVEDVRRLGGFGIAAHPTSRRPALAWSDPSLPLDAVEWINGDTAWRDENWTSLLRVLFGYWIRPSESLALLLARPEPALALWDELASARRVVGLGAVDAHARLATGSDDEGYGGAGPAGDRSEEVSLRLPDYESVFRALSVQVELDRPLGSSAGPDASAILSSLRNGRVYTVVDAIARPAWFSWTGETVDGNSIRMGEWTAGDATVTLTARIAAPDDATFTLRRNGEPVVAGEPGPTLTYRTPVAPNDWTAYRVEVFLPEAPGSPPVPWIVGNPIYVGGGAVAASGAVDDTPATLGNRPFAGEWRVEQNDAEVSLTSEVLPPGAGSPGGQVRLTFELGSDPETYAAAVHAIGPGGMTRATAIRFEVSASRPMRPSLQLRRGGPAGSNGDRWRRSFYAGPEPRTVTVPLDQFTAVTPELAPRPDAATLDSLLIVLDTVNTSPGTRGVLTITEPRLIGP